MTQQVNWMKVQNHRAKRVLISNLHTSVNKSVLPWFCYTGTMAEVRLSCGCSSMQMCMETYWVRDQLREVDPTRWEVQVTLCSSFLCTEMDTRLQLCQNISSLLKKKGKSASTAIKTNSDSDEAHFHSPLFSDRILLHCVKSAECQQEARLLQMCWGADEEIGSSCAGECGGQVIRRGETNKRCCYTW